MKFSFRGPRRKQKGFGIAETILGLALGFTAVVTGTQFMSNTLEATTTASVVQDRTTMIAEALNRTSQNIQVADPVLYAGKDELMTKSVDGTGATVMTRFVKHNNAYYHQTWTGFTGSYVPAPGLWIAPTSLAAAAPNGDGDQTSTLLVSDLVNGKDLGVEDPAKEIFLYHGADGALIDVSIPATSTAGNTNAIKLVDVTLAATTESPSFFQNQTSAAPRNMTAGVTDGTIVAPDCPDLTLTGTTQPILTWTTVAGAASYDVYRNTAVATNVVVSSGATTGTWKDTSNPAASSDSTTYRVVAKSAAGVVSSSCARPQVWRTQIGLPQLVNSTVLPNGVNASDWNGTGLTTPRIVLNWNAVPGASGYQLFYRQVDPMTGAQIGSGTYTNVTLDDSVLTYSWDGGGFGRRYEWYLKADSRSGQSKESRHIQIMTHPGAPPTTAVKAEYGSATYGKNVLSWTAASTAGRYDVWRYQSGSTGPVSIRVRTSDLTHEDTAVYGSNYSYYVGARNYGPRGTDAAGNDLNEDRSSPSPESVATAWAKPDKVTQLQYPPVPEMAPVGAAAGSTRDYDGTNRIEWNPATSATGYKVGRYTVGGGALTCLTGTNCDVPSGGTTATQLDNPVAKGTQYDYAVLAYNATGMSVDFSAKERVTQRPAAPPVNLVRAPDLSLDTADFTSAQTADAGNSAADRFCTSTTCSYELYRSGSLITIFKHQQSGAGIAWNNVPNPSGATLNYTARAKNAAITNGGWSDNAVEVVNTYPGEFSLTQQLGDNKGAMKSRLRVNLVSTDLSGTANGIQNGYTTIIWGASEGASWFDYSRTAEAHGDLGTATVGLPDRDWYYGSRQSGAAADWTVVASPGALYHYNIVAHAPNGLSRAVQTPRFWTPPDVPTAGTTIITCSNNTYSDQTTARYDFPSHKIGARLIALNKTPRYGTHSTTGIIGMAWYKGSSSTDTSWTTLTGGQANPEVNSGPGQGYYYGVNNGFRIWNAITGGPTSTVLWQSIRALATFNHGCGPDGGTWWDLWEPTNACYGYVPGQPCSENRPENRPQWRSY